MRIGIDARAICVEHYTGISNYVEQIIVQSKTHATFSNEDMQQVVIVLASTCLKDILTKEDVWFLYMLFFRIHVLKIDIFLQRDKHFG